MQVVVYLRDVELGVTAFNEAWDEWKVRGMGRKFGGMQAW